MLTLTRAMLSRPHMSQVLLCGPEATPFTSVMLTSVSGAFTDAISSGKPFKGWMLYSAWSSSVDMLMLAVVRRAAGSRVYDGQQA